MSDAHATDCLGAYIAELYSGYEPRHLTGAYRPIDPADKGAC